MCALYWRAGRYSKGSGEDNPKRWKATFRCGLNSCNSARARTIVPQPTLDEECKRAHRPARVFLIVDDADYRQWVRESERAGAGARAGTSCVCSSASSLSGSGSCSSELVEVETGETRVGMRLKATRIKRPPTDHADGPHAKRLGLGLGLSQSHSHSQCANKAAAGGGRFQGIIIPAAAAANAEPAAVPLLTSEPHFGKSLSWSPCG